MTKVGLRVSAAFALISVATSPLGAAKLRLPPPKAPTNQIFSAAAIAKDLQKRGYRIEKMKRKGTTYSITATGPSKNKVQMTVDGRSGDVVGLAVLNAAANLAGAIAAIVKSGKGARYVDDWHPFGIIIPDTYQTHWVSYPANSWTTYTTRYVPEVWSGAGYRFAVPYQTVRPGYGGTSVTTFSTSEMRESVYDVYDYNGSVVTTEYSEESTEISETSAFEKQYGAEDEQLDQSYLGGGISDDDVDVDDVADYDSEDGDFNVADESDDGYDADVGDDDDSQVDTDTSGDDEADEADEADGDGDDDQADDPGDDGDDDQADDPGVSGDE
ncbi:MAG: PepSY domain-containing protein [Sphingomicrobium sp.]